MRIALDATPLRVSTGGVRRYTEELALALAREFPEDQYHLISDQPFHYRGEPAANLLVEPNRPRGAVERRWWLFGVQREMARLGVELFHGTDFSVPYLGRRPSVMTVHDLSPWMNEGWHHAASRVRLRTPFLIRSGRAAMIITPSEAVRRQVIDRFRADPDRVVSIPEAAPDWMRPASGAAAAPYFLYVGTLEPRKNVPVLLEAWREVRKRHDVELVLAGRTRRDFPALFPEPGLRILGEIPDADLAGLYSGCVAAIYVSLYEGFGLPVLEAMQCGAAVIASRDPAIVEVSGGAAVHVQATDRAGLAAAMEAMVVHPDEQRRRKDLSLARAAEFSWRKTAILTREVYVEALRRFKR